MVQRNLLAMQISVLLAFILFYSSTASTEGKKPPMPGVVNWVPITNTYDPKVVEIGRFAVTKHNKMAHTALQFVVVVKGETRFARPGGCDYKLTIKVRDYTAPGNYGFGVKTYEVVVSDKRWTRFGSWTLVSFTEIVVPAPPTWMPIKTLYNPSVVELAKFAVAEHNKVARFPLNFFNLVEGQTLTLGPAILDYKLTIRAGGHHFVRDYEAVIVSHYPNTPWNTVELISFTPKSP